MSSGQPIWTRPVFAMLLRPSSAINFPECRWVRRALLFPIAILNKCLTGLRPVVSFISLGQPTVTPLFTPKSMPEMFPAEGQRIFRVCFIFLTAYSVQLDLTFGINTSSLVSVYIVEPDINVKSNVNNSNSTVVTEVWARSVSNGSIRLFFCSSMIWFVRVCSIIKKSPGIILPLFREVVTIVLETYKTAFDPALALKSLDQVWHLCLSI